MEIAIYRSTVLSINNHVMGVIVFDVVLSMLALYYTCIYLYRVNGIQKCICDLI